MTKYARAPRARVDHIVAADGTATRCGKALTNMAVWPAIYSNRTELRATCDACLATNKGA